MRYYLLVILLYLSNQGFAATCPDGSDPSRTVSADGTYYEYFCKQKTAKSGLSIENDPLLDFFKPPQKPHPTGQMYYFGRMWQMADFNKDGFSDVLFIGTMNPNNIDMIGEDTGGICGGGECKGEMPPPALFLGDNNNELTYSPELIIDNRKVSGMSLGRQLLVADYNNDEVLDFYIADHGIGTHSGIRDSYFLSHPDGTWIESSETHLSHSNFKVFDHGAATGDIDRDGDMDVVITNTDWRAGTSLWCLVNDGTGFLNKRKCGGIFSFALELADIDGDGYLDVLLGAHEFEDSINFTGIVWNDGKGYFPKNKKTSLPQHKKKWGTIPEVSAADLDNDGDLDIVYSRSGVLYVGTALQIIENLGDKQFKDHGIFPLVEAPDSYIPTHEGNEWNDFIEMIKFRDIDADGDMDIYLASSMSRRTNGMILLNHGDFSFELLKPNKAKAYLPGYIKKTVSIEKLAQDEAIENEIEHFEADLEKELSEKVIQTDEQQSLEQKTSLMVDEQLNTLQTGWLNYIALLVESNIDYKDLQSNWNCSLYVEQERDGTVISVESLDCFNDSQTLSRTQEQTLSDIAIGAVVKASPLPPAPNDSVFEKLIIFDVSAK